jgi:hypothetical protein
VPSKSLDNMFVVNTRYWFGTSSDDSYFGYFRLVARLSLDFDVGCDFVVLSTVAVVSATLCSSYFSSHLGKIVLFLSRQILLCRLSCRDRSK